MGLKQSSPGSSTMCSSWKPPDLQRVGRDGRLKLLFCREGGKTILGDFFSTMPLSVLPPFYPDDSGCAYSYIINPTSGLVGGDRLVIEIALEEGAHAFITAPSATKVYKSSDHYSEHITDLWVKKQGRLEYFPRTVIPFAGSRYKQKTRISLEESATAFIVEGFTTGRTDRKERLAFKEYRSSLEITYGGKMIAADRFTLRPEVTDYAALGYFESLDTVMSVYLVFDDPLKERKIIEEINALFAQREQLLGGVTTLPLKGIMVRLLGRGATQLEDVVLHIHSIVRKKILGKESSAFLKRFIT